MFYRPNHHTFTTPEIDSEFATTYTNSVVNLEEVREFYKYKNNKIILNFKRYSSSTDWVFESTEIRDKEFDKLLELLYDNGAWLGESILDQISITPPENVKEGDVCENCFDRNTCKVMGCTHSKK